jgi:hypothetical protein
MEYLVKHSDLSKNGAVQKIKNIFSYHRNKYYYTHSEVLNMNNIMHVSSYLLIFHKSSTEQGCGISQSLQWIPQKMVIVTCLKLNITVGHHRDVE